MPLLDDVDRQYRGRGFTTMTKESTLVLLRWLFLTIFTGLAAVSAEMSKVLYYTFAVTITFMAMDQVAMWWIVSLHTKQVASHNLATRVAEVSSRSIFRKVILEAYFPWAVFSFAMWMSISSIREDSVGVMARLTGFYIAITTAAVCIAYLRGRRARHIPV